MAEVLCGPLVRYIDRRRAVIWLEIDDDLEIEVALAPLRNGEPLPEMRVHAFPVKVGDTWYAWVACGPLLPDTWYEYRITGRDADGVDRELWPDRALTGTGRPSRFRTLPLFSVSGLKVAFGSCRAGFPPDDPKTAQEGLDALNAYAERLARQADGDEAEFPAFIIFTGDQIYGDNLSFAKRREFARRRENPVETNHATTYAEYAALYREAWTTFKPLRWMLSCVPSFMIFDDHDVTDDWNTTEQWVEERLRSLGHVRLMRDALLAYWVYQGAGNLSPRRWRSDERNRLLTPSFRSPFRDVTRRLTGLFDQYIRRRRHADWGFAIDAPGTRFVVADTRMSRKLTGKRLIMDDAAWADFTTRALDARARKTILVLPSPFLVGHPLHDLVSRVAESIEGNPPSVIGGIAGGLVGGLLFGPAGAIAGVVAGTIGGEYLLDTYGEDLVRKADIELWAAFPTSFDRMLGLLEQLQDGVGTTPKRFIGLISGDVHHSNVFQGDFRRTSRTGSVLNLTMSPLQRRVSPDDESMLRDLEGGTWYFDTLNALERPDFVEEQRRRLDWYPLDTEGRRAPYDDQSRWNHYGKFVGELDIDAVAVTYRYLQATERGGRVALDTLTERRVLAV